MNDIYNQLIKTIIDEDFDKTYEICERIKIEGNGIDYIEPLLLFMEKNEGIDYGMPGPIVHFMEYYLHKGYEKLLLESINRMPTFHTVWMLNRLINVPNLFEKSKYLDAMESIISRNDVSSELKREVQDYIDYQRH